MFSRRSPPQPTPTRSDRVRQLWAQFEAWHAAETKRIEQQVTSELKDLDNKWQKTPSKKRGSKAEHEERKKTRRKEIQKTFTGNMVREEWQNRLDKAGLRSDDWTNMTEVEQRSVERILGADLDLEAMELPVVQSTPSPPSGSLFAPPMTSDSRTASAVSDNYAVVKPNYEPWMQVVHKPRSDDEVSLDASTTSSWGFSGGDGPAYLSWSSEASRSSAQTSQASSPEHATKYLAPEVKQQSLLSAAARRLSAATERPSRNEGRHATPPQHHQQSTQIPLSRTESLNSLSSEPMSDSLDEPSSSRAVSKSHAGYIGPYLTDPNETVDEETEFYRFKMNIRIQKIREFHEEAATADIDLLLEIDEARRMRKSNKDSEAKLVEEHGRKMLQLRASKEEERKAIVEAERYKRRAAMRGHGRREPAPEREFDLPPSIATQFLKGLKDSEASIDAGGASDTPTIRSQQRRARKPSLHADWMSGGGDTPTPTSRVSAWAASASHLSQTPMTDSVEMFAETAPLKRGSRKVAAADATPTKQEEPSPWSFMAKAQKLAASVVDATLATATTTAKTEEEPSPWQMMSSKKAQKTSSASAAADITPKPRADEELSPWSIMTSKKAQKSTSSLLAAEATPTKSKADDEPSPWQIMAAKKAQKSASSQVEPKPTPAPVQAEELSPWQIMAAKQMQKSVSSSSEVTAPVQEELSPWQTMAVKKAQAQKSGVEVAPTPVEELSPWEIMAAKKAQTQKSTSAVEATKEEPSPWEMMAAKKSIPGGWDEESADPPPTSSTQKKAAEKEKGKEKAEKVEPAKPTLAPVPVTTGKGKKKKGKAAAAQVQSEVSSSEASSTSAKTKAGSAPDPPASAKSAKESKTLPTVPESKVPAPSKVEPSPSLAPSTSSSSTWSTWSSSSAASTIPPLSSSQQFPAGSSKAAGKKPEVSGNASSSSSSTSGILKKPGTSKTKSAKAGKKKKVTIEEVSDEEDEDPVPDGVERLPSDSRYIMEPTPVVPAERYSQIIEFGEGEEQQKRPDVNEYERWSPASIARAQQQQQQQQQQIQQQPERWTPSRQQQHQYNQYQQQPEFWAPGGQENERWVPSASGSGRGRTPSQQQQQHPEPNDAIWLPGGFQNTEAVPRTRSTQPSSFDWNGHPAPAPAPISASASTSSYGHGASSSSQGMNEYATWTPGNRMSYASEADGPGQDLFLSALDSLEKIVRDNEPSSGMRREEAYESRNLDRLLSGVGRGLERERHGDGGDALWHAIASYGQRGSATSAW